MSETLRKYGAKYNTTFCSFCGLSTDSKPTGLYEGVYIANGSEFIEMDTDKKYLFDAESQTWKLAASGGGGGGGSATLIEKTITTNGEYNAASDNADGYSKVTVSVTNGVSFANSPTTFDLRTNINSVDVVIPSGITKIGNGAFYNCVGLTSVTIPSGVTSIDTQAFLGCTSLTTLTIPSTVTTLGTSALSGLSGLTELKFEPTTPPSVSNSNTFKNLPTTCVIKVPTGSLSAYTSSNNYPSSSTYTYVEY